jgi:hypothetical protein
MSIELGARSPALSQSVGTFSSAFGQPLEGRFTGRSQDREPSRGSSCSPGQEEGRAGLYYGGVGGLPGWLFSDSI